MPDRAAAIAWLVWRTTDGWTPRPNGTDPMMGEPEPLELTQGLYDDAVRNIARCALSMCRARGLAPDWVDLPGFWPAPSTEPVPF